MNEWKECLLGDVITFQRGYDLPSKNMVGNKYPVVGSNGIIGWHNEYTTEAPSITIGRSGNVGKPFLYNGKTWSHNTTLFIKEYKNAEPYFIYYFLKTLNLSHFAGGSAVPTLNRNHIHSISIRIPPLPTQQKIAAVLSALDDKIELNRQINANLEQQAQAIFKNWFVDFEPFGGQMPRGWRVGKLSEIADITSGKRPPMKQSTFDKNINIPLVGAASIMGYTNQVLYNEQILITRRVGTHGIVQRFSTNCWPSDNTLVIKSKHYEYVYQIMKNIDYQNMNRGSTQPLITQSDLGKVECIVPNSESLTKFELISNKLFNIVEANNFENKTLAAIRDTLLPKLMSGELDVSSVKV